MSILDDIVAAKQEEISARKRSRPVSDLTDAPLFSRTPLSLVSALSAAGRFHIIAEVKRGSPSAGEIAREFDPPAIAFSYEAAQASAISVLTDGRFFGGSLDDLASVRARVSLPLLRKDFILDPYQLFEAKGSGADAVLLIAGILERPRLLDLFMAARELALDALVEVHHESELDRVDPDIMPLFGVNNRDLADFTVDLSRSLALVRRFPASSILVSESGIRTAADCRRLRDGGFRAALVGETLMRSADPGRALRDLLEGMGDAA